MAHLLALLAQNEQPGWYPLVLITGVVMMIYFVLILPGRRRDQERKTLLSGLSKNDKVLTTGGIYGTVVAVSDKEDEVTVKVDDNVRLKMVKDSILRNLTKEEAARAPKATKEGGA
jgi:preprotein translocase subunit YajC